MNKESKIALITIGTDGPTNWVQTADGQRYNLGAVSVLKLISKLVPLRIAKTALKEYLENKQAMLSVDLNKMWNLLPFHRARFSFDNKSLIEKANYNLIREANMEKANYNLIREANMNTVGKELIRSLMIGEKEGRADRELTGTPKFHVAEAVEQIKEAIAGINGDVSALQMWVKQGKLSNIDKGVIDSLSASLSGLFYWVGVAKEQMPKQASMTVGKQASFETFTANTELAEDIVAKVAAANETVDRLVQEGKRFNAERAKEDLHKIASKVAEIAQNVDLAHPWVSNDLEDLSQSANKIYGLFHPKG